MRKAIFCSSALAFVLTGCSLKDSVMDVPQQPMPLQFGTMASNMTKGADLEDVLDNFQVFGLKTNASNSSEVVFPDYVVTHDGSDWSYSPVKYWDNSAKGYDFYAVAPASAVTSITPDAAYVVDASSDVYVTDQTHVAPAAYGEEVLLTFRKVNATANVAFYETVPGYSVKNLKFYAVNHSSATGNSGADAVLYVTSTNVIKSAEEYSITYEDGVAIANPSGTLVDVASLDFGLVDYAGEADINGTAVSGVLAETNAEATLSKGTAVTVWPTQTGVVLKLCADYDLYSIDSDEVIHVSNVLATVPATATVWAANTNYTYVFRITADQLMPIVFDAVIADEEDVTVSTEYEVK